MNNWKEELDLKFPNLGTIEYFNGDKEKLPMYYDLIKFIENLLEETKKEERERIINEIENVVNGLFMNYEEKIDIMKERLEEFKTNK